MIAQVQNYTSPVITLKPDNTVNDALQLMLKKEIKRIVLTGGDFPLGIVTERDIGKFLNNDKTKRTLDKILLEEIMSRNLVTVTMGPDHLIQCAIRMETFRISSIIVVDDNGKLIGITTKSDLAKSFSNLYRGIYKIKDYMTKKVFTCRKSDSILFVLDMIDRNEISRIIVTDNEGKPAGIVTYHSLLLNSEYFKDGKEPSTKKYFFSRESKKTLVGDIIGNEILTITLEEDLAKAANLMTRYKTSGLPVLDEDGNLVGVVSTTDVVRAYSEVETHFRLIKHDPHFV